MRDSVAAALNVRSENVKIDHWRLSPGQRSTRCWGTSLGKRFFAKTLALDPYRLVPRVAVPGKEAVANGNSCRSASEQIEAEWSMTQRLRKLVGNEAVPAPLGKSIATKTVVWEQATGARMDDSVRRSRWMDHRGNAGGAALFQAGSWLKKLHNASAHREAAINCGELIRGVRELLQSQGLSSSGYASTALQLLETARHRTGGNDLLMPTVLSHGDFTLANMLWDKKASHLWIVDFEDFAERTPLHDLVTIIFDLRVLLLNPFVSRLVIRRLEKSFWEGYGNLSPEMLIWVNALACSRIFYYSLPRLSGRQARRGWLAAGMVSVYKLLLEPSMIDRCLSQDFPPALNSAELSVVPSSNALRMPH